MKARRLLTLFLVAVAGSVLFSSCATICASRMQSVHLFDAPKDLTITVDSVAVADSKPSDKKSDQPYYSMDQFANTANYATGATTTFFVKSFRARGFKTHIVKFHSDELNKTGTFILKPKFNFRWVLGNLVSWGVAPGMVVDFITGKWKNLRPNFVDVPAILNGTPQRSKGQLKRAAKRALRHGR